MELTRRVAIAVVALFLIALTGMSIITVMAARGRDADTRELSRKSASAALRVAQDRLAEIVTDYALWDKAFDNLHQGFDPKWARRNIVNVPHEVYGIHHILLYAPMDHRYLNRSSMRAALNPGCLTRRPPLERL